MKTIRAKLIVFIILPALFVYVLILGGTLWFLRGRSLESVGSTMTRRASDHAGRFDGFLREAAAVADTTAAALSFDEIPPEKSIFQLLRSQIDRRAFLYGAAAAFEPGVVRDPGTLYAPYVHRQKDSLHEMNISGEVYDWYSDPKWTWFQQPKALRRPVWSAPYFDEGAGNILMTTYSAPFFHDGEFRGVATVDIDLARLRETIGGEIVDEGDFVVLGTEGHFIYAERSDWILSRSITDLARETSNHELQQLIPALLGGFPGVAMTPGWADPQKQLLSFAPIPSTGWTLLCFLPERVALAGLRRQMMVASGALAATLFLIILSIVHVSRRITRPLEILSAGVGRIAEGDLDARVALPPGRDEIGLLAVAFNSMAAKLRSHVERLADEEASRRKLERDLEIAREIQRGLLPVKHPELPGYDIAGWSRAADQTGGDYYDWQTLPDGTIAISLADVTGHGIGPALVTAACRAYARASFTREPDLGGVLNQVNALLCDDLQGGRFVTYVAAVINPGTHRIQMLSAGHGPLVIYQAADDEVRLMNAHHFPLGITDQTTHGPPSDVTLAPGDLLLFITDGFFEWPNREGEQYGLDRLAAAIRDAHLGSSREIIERIVESVLEFSEGTQQMDDLTALVLKRE